MHTKKKLLSDDSFRVFLFPDFCYLINVLFIYLFITVIGTMSADEQSLYCNRLIGIYKGLKIGSLVLVIILL